MEVTYKFSYGGNPEKEPAFSRDDLRIAELGDQEELESIGFFEDGEVDRFLKDSSIFIYRMNGKYAACGTYLVPFWRSDIPDGEKGKYRDVGMHVNAGLRRRGIGRSVVQNLTLLALEQGYIPIAECAVDNKSSRMTLESAGYRLNEQT